MTWRLVVIIFISVICFATIQQGELAADAIRYAAISQHILDYSDWFRLFDPTTETPYANKPPLLLWMVAFNLKLFGFSTFVAKFPSALMVAVSLYLIWSCVREYKNELVAMAALLLFMLNINFGQNILDLNFEGLVILGSILTIKSIFQLSKLSDGSIFPERAAFAAGIGFLLLLQSKPPFAALMLAVLFFWLWLESRSYYTERLLSHSIPKIQLPARSALLFLLPIFLGLLWYIFAPRSYLVHFAENQLITPLSNEPFSVKQIIYWLLSPFKNYTLVALTLCIAIYDLLKRDLRQIVIVSSPFQRFLLLLACSFFPIALVAGHRPRYAAIPMLALTILIAPYLEKYLLRTGSARFKIILVVCSFLVFFAFSAFDISVHRRHKALSVVRSYNKPFLNNQIVCVETPEHDPEKFLIWKRKMRLLLKLTFRHDFQVYSSDEVTNLKLNPDEVIADQICRARL